MKLKFYRKHCCDICGMKKINNKFIVPFKNYCDNSTNKLNYVNCECGNIYLSTPPNNSSIKYIYSPLFSEYYSFSSKIGKVTRFFRDAVLRKKFNSYLTHIKIKKNKNKIKIIDIGCGDCSLLMSIRNKSKFLLSAHDIYNGNKELIENEGIKFYSGDIENNSINEKFDMIICNQVIEHSLNPNKFMSSLKLLGHKESIFIFETPNNSSIDLNIFKGFWGGFHAPQHINIFNPNSVLRLFEKNNFTIINIDQITSTWSWCSAIKNLGLHKYKLFFDICGSLKNPFTLSFFTIVDLIRIHLGFSTSNMRIISKLKKL